MGLIRSNFQHLLASHAFWRSEEAREHVEWRYCGFVDLIWQRVRFPSSHALSVSPIQLTTSGMLDYYTLLLLDRSPIRRFRYWILQCLISESGSVIKRVIIDPDSPVKCLSASVSEILIGVASSPSIETSWSELLIDYRSREGLNGISEIGATTVSNTRHQTPKKTGEISPRYRSALRPRAFHSLKEIVRAPSEPPAEIDWNLEWNEKEKGRDSQNSIG